MKPGDSGTRPVHPRVKKLIEGISQNAKANTTTNMASVRKRKMARSSVKKNTKKVKDKQRNVKMTAHPVMQAHWDNKLTLKQNYKKLGLTVRLGKPAGGEEAPIQTLTEYRKEREDKEETQVKPEAVANETDPEKIPEGEARLIRDPETNEVVQIIYGKMKANEKKSEESKDSIIAELINYNEEHAKPVAPKTPSARESAWLEKLAAKYGEDYEKMKWDRKLNPMLFSVGQLKKKMAQLRR